MSDDPGEGPARPLDLIGSWTLERRVHDRRLHRFGRVDGRVDFVADGPAVRWLESGTFHWGGQSFDVSRQLRIVPVVGGWMVRFSDGHDFHPWAPGQVVTHPCRADTYCGLVRVDEACSTLRVLWDVTGPVKDQRLLTRCRRRPAPVS